MHDEDSETTDPGAGRFSRGGAWPALIVALGLSLWAQIFALPLLDQLHFADQGVQTLLVYLIAPAALLAGVAMRAAPMTLLVFPLCFVPGMLLLPGRNLLELQQASSMVRIGVTLAAFIAAAAAGHARRQTVGQEVDGGAGVPRRVDGIYRFYFALRGAILLGLLAVIQWATFRDRAIAATIAQHYGDKPQSAVMFIGLVGFFAWCVAAYTMFFVPMMNLEYDVRKLSRAIDHMADGGRRARWRRIGTLAALAVGAVAVAWALT